MKTYKNKQSGFTLIELVVVILILGILAAIALPKFVNLGEDARVASVNGARASMSSLSAMAHSKYVLTSPAPLTTTIEGTVVTYSTAFLSGYPKADAAFAAASGLNTSDYTLTIAGTTLTVSPVSAPVAATCSIIYAEPISAITAPVLTLSTAGC